MATIPSIPLSELIRSAKESDKEEGAEPTLKSRDEWKKAKELEEARKAGTAPAAVDEEGRDINPHIPQYISSAPWYYGTRTPTLKHQRQQPEDKKTYSSLNEWYRKGVDLNSIATKYRKGACENCGAMTHKKKDCLERPRKIGAKYTGSDIAPDELAQPDLSLDFDGKRDRWNGYDPTEYIAVVDEFQKVEEAKRHLRAEKLRTMSSSDLPDNMVMDPEDVEDDEDKYVDDVDMPGTKVDSKQRITVRNLRIREDTAKYLRNLDPNSAYYDPKTRAMRDNPYKDTGKNPEELNYAGENFIRFTGDTNKHAQAQLFAWEAQEKGVDVHLLAEPTKLEVLQKEFDKKKDEFKGSLTRNVMDTYGGEEHLKAPPKTLLMAQTEDYVEYSRQGKIIKGCEKPVIRSKYEEDVYPNNHSSIFGSFWRDGNWGYRCCHSLLKNSYCTGDTGRAVNDNLPVPDTIKLKENIALVAAELRKKQEEAAASNPKTLVEIHRENLAKEAEKEKEKAKTEKQLRNQKAKEKKRLRRKARAAERKKREDRNGKSSSSSSSSESDSGSSSSSSSEDEETKKKSELKKALAKEEKRQREADTMMDDRKRAYNSRYDVKQPTEAEIEAFQMKRMHEDDPMLQFMEKKKKY